MKCRFIFVLFSVFLISGWTLPSSVLANYYPPSAVPTAQILPFTPDMITVSPLARREEGLDIQGSIPYISNQFGTPGIWLNERINQIAEQKTAAAKGARARSIQFNYALFISDSLVSIIIYSTVTSASSKIEVTSVNFDPIVGKQMTLTESIGYDIAPLAEKILAERIRANPEKYNAAFDQFPFNPAFYLDGEKLVLLFDEFMLEKGASGVSKLEISLPNILRVDVQPQDYLITAGYMVKMIPLRQVCDAFGYIFETDPSARRISLYRDNRLAAELYINENRYTVPDKRERALEAAPEMIQDVVYVPISFFDQILNLVTYSIDMAYNIDAANNVGSAYIITFLSYREA